MSDKGEKRDAAIELEKSRQALRDLGSRATREDVKRASAATKAYDAAKKK